MLLLAMLWSCAEVPAGTTFDSSLDLLVDQWWEVTWSTDESMVGDCIWLGGDGEAQVRLPARHTGIEWGVAGPHRIEFAVKGIAIGSAHITGGPGEWAVSWDGMLYPGAEADFTWGCEQVGYDLDPDYPWWDDTL